jgi:peptidoglycan/xylan/chitin deacetylase (PgdA/CDA1 family)
MSIKTKSMLASLLQRTGVTAWKLGRYSHKDYAVLMYHRILPKMERAQWVQPGMVVEPDTLDLHIRYLRKEFEIVPLSDLAMLNEGSPETRSKRRLCVLTFDDGWYDFYRHAFPILKMHNAPATVFLPTDFVGTDRWFWTDRVGRLLEWVPHAGSTVNDGSASRDPLVSQILKMRGPYEARLESVMALLKPCRIDQIEDIVSELAGIVGKEPELMDRAFVSWEEVREMSGSGLVSFGSHTAVHPILTTLSEHEARNELKKSRDCLFSQRVADPAFVPFCYPNGNFSETVAEMVRDAGYHLAVTTRQGWNQPGDNPYTLRRIAIHQDMTSTEAMFGARIVNLL